MNDIVRARVQIQVLVDLGLLSEVDALSFWFAAPPPVVPCLTKPHKSVSDAFVDRGHEGVQLHRAHESGADCGVPSGRVVIVGAREHVAKSRADVR